MNSLTLDHAILVVSDLQVATRQFTQLGFSVIAGGVHEGGLTHNALIPFPDGTYLQLLSTTRRSTLKTLGLLRRLRLLGIYTSNETAIDRRLIEDIASGVGLNDYALLSADLEREITNIKQRKVKFSDPIPGGRLRPDGKETTWRTAVPLSLDLPFLIEDITPREVRVPAVENDYHPNSLVGIKGVTVVVTDLVESMTHYRALLDAEPITQPQHPQPATQSIEFTLESRFLSIVSPLPGKSEIRSLLKHRSARPVGVFFRTLKDAESEMLSLTYLPKKGATLSRSSSFFA
jgi:hypothetical protein